MIKHKSSHISTNLTWLTIFTIALTFFIALASSSFELEAAQLPVYISPLPGAQFVSIKSPIIVRFDNAVDLTTFSETRSAISNKNNHLFEVRGEESGQHTGTIELAADGKTIIFTPDQQFATGETVTVVISKPLQADDQNGSNRVSTSFTTSTQTPEEQVDLRQAQKLDEQVGQLWQESITLAETDPTRVDYNQMVEREIGRTANQYVTLPADYPTISVTTNLDNKADGYIFLSNFTVNWTAFDFSQSRPFLLILDNDGEPVFHQRLPLIAADFKAHDNGLLSYYVGGSGEFTVMNSAYEIVDTWTGVGYGADIHDFLMLPNGNVIIMIYDFQPIDMSQHVEGGDPNATVVGLILQELDAEKNLVFEWRSWDHFSFTDSHVDLTSDNVDYVHGNSVEVDTDGNWIISSRGLDEITKISRQTGQIMWRLGGKKNQFRFEPETGEPFLEQHDARRLPNGNLQLFDNRSQTGPYARAVEYELDEVNLIARRVWEYRAPAPRGSLAMGSARRLANGNTIIGWGSMYPSVTEVDQNGLVQFELSLQQHPNNTGNLIITNSYRAFKLPWEGEPAWPPDIVEKSEGEEEVTVYYSWNGATDTLFYNVYSGPTADSLDFRGTQLATGFETSTSLPATADHCYIAVEPVDSDQNIGPRSETLFGLHCLNEKIFLPFSVWAGGPPPGNPLGP